MKFSGMWAAAAVAVVVAAAGLVGLKGMGQDHAIAADSPLGKAENFRLSAHDLQAYELYRMADAKAIVLFTQTNGCPVVRNTGPDLKALKAAYKDKGVEFLMLNSNLQDKREAIAAEVKEFGFDMPVLMDSNQLVGEQLGVTRSAEAIIIDPKTWQVVYRGPINDRVTYERQKAKADNEWAAKALDALLAGRKPQVAYNEPIGCLINFPEREKRADHAKISYVRDIAPIVEQKCVTCHQPGGIGPMQFTNYEQIKGFSPMIREVIRTDRMPPFHADPSVGKFHDDKSLSPAQIKTLVHWIEAGSPRGTGTDPLASKSFKAPEWELGPPDLVLDIPAYKIPASGIVDYQRPWVANPLTEGKWLRASTIKVGERQGVHHILTGYMATPPTGPTANESRWGASVGGYAVGAESTTMPKDVGTFLPPGGAIGFQNHYTPFGKEAEDKSQIALYFYKEPPKMIMRSAVIADPTLSIPPGVERHKEVAYVTFPKDALLYSAFPHAHYRGEASEVTIEYPDGRREILVALPKYDFNWQREYAFEEPVRVPAGSKVIATYTYNNSKRNPANPDPARTVPWGDQSFDEMLYTALRYRWIEETVENQTNYDQLLAATRTLGMMDDNINGKLELAELKGTAGAPIRAAFTTLDGDKDGSLNAAELQAAQALMQRGRGAAPAAAPPAAPRPGAAAPATTRGG